MSDEVERLVVAAFKEIVEKANAAIANAKDAEEEVAAPMLKAAQSLAKEGERALKRIEPLCHKNYDDYGANFVDAIKEHDEIAQFRSELDDLLWDFDDYVEVDGFDVEKFEELQKTSRKAAPKIVDILKRMKLVTPVTAPVSAPVSAPASVSTPASVTASIVVDSPPTNNKGLQQGIGEVLTMGSQAGPDLGVDGAPGAVDDLGRSTSPPSEVSDALLDPPPRPPSADPWQVGRPPSISLPSLPEGAKPMARRSPVPPGDSPTLPVAYPVEKVSTMRPQHAVQHIDSWMLKEEDRRKQAVPISSSEGAIQTDPLVAYWGSRTSTTATAVSAGRPRAGSSNRPLAVDRTRPSPTISSGNEPPRYSGQSTDSAPSSSPRHSRPPSNASPLFGHSSPTIPENIAINNLTHKNGYTGIVSFPPRQTSLGQTHPPLRQPSTDSLNSSIFDCVTYDGSSSPVASTQRTSVLSATTPGSPYSPGAQLPQYSAHPPVYQNGTMSPVLSSSATIGNQSSATLTTIATMQPRPHTSLEGSVTSPVQRVDDPGLIPVETELPENTPMPARQPDCSIGPNSSFYQMKGFCKGAEEALRGELGLKKIRRPMGSYSTAVVAKCNHCLFELDYKAVEADLNNDSTGNFSSNTIGFRLRIIQKSHLRVSHVDESLYGCLFCIHQGHTNDESDATVFFTRKQLFQHMARHPRPLPSVPGLTVIEGAEIPPQVRDNFDLHFSQPPLQSVMHGIAPEISKLPAATAVDTTKNSQGILRSPPDRAGVLQFAVGARIVGIEFPARYEGKWGIGWHDGIRAAFEADSVSLSAPPRAEIRMQGTSSLQAVARWKWHQKGEGNWLKFDKGDVIKNISWVYTDHWCWSGTSNKGWGIFPQTHLEPNTVRSVQGDTASVMSAEKKSGLSRFSIRRNTDKKSGSISAGSV